MTLSRWASARLSSVEKRSSTDASSTFFALLFKFRHLLGQIFVALCHLAARVVGKDAFPLGALLGGKFFDRVSTFWLKRLFALFLIYAGIRYLL